MNGTVHSVSPEHVLNETRQPQIRLLAGLVFQGDWHAEGKIQHLSRVRQGSGQPNLRQVHLIHGELPDELAGRDLTVRPGDLIWARMC